MSEIDSEEWKELPAFVVLNPMESAMFHDPDRSGMHLVQWGGKDSEGNELKMWGPVPKKMDCSAVKMALDVGILFQCNPKGESRHLPAPIVQEDTIEDLMGKSSRELTAYLPHINDAVLLSKMREWEEGRPRKEIRTPLLREIRMRMESVNGLSAVRAEVAMVDNGSGKMVPDNINITR